MTRSDDGPTPSSELDRASLTIVGLLAGHAELCGESVAVECDGRAMSFADLDVQSDACARALRASGVGHEDRIAFLAYSTVEYFVFLLGAIKAGAVAVPINWRLAPSEIEAVLADSEARLLVGDAVLLDPVIDRLSELTRLNEVITLQVRGDWPDWETWLESGRASAHVAPDIHPETVVLQIYTSGTTGRPKGVLTRHDALLAYLATLADVARLSVESISLSTMPLFHIGGSGWVLAGLSVGASTLIVRDPDADEILRLVDARAVTNLIAVPAVIQRMLGSPDVEGTSFDSLRTLYYGGGPMTASELRAALDTFGCDLVQGFGMSECPLITALSPADHRADPAYLRSCGRPVRDTEVRLVDPATLHDVAVGDVGEIWVRSPSVMAGYWHQPETTGQALCEGWLRTGDAARADLGGRLYLQDRIKDMIVTGGENVYPAEVENALMSHPDVSECTVIGVPSPTWTEEVKALVVPRAGARVSEEDVIAHCRTLIARYKCPKSVEFVQTLPRTPSGKIQKYILRERYAGGTSYAS